MQIFFNSVVNETTGIRHDPRWDYAQRSLSNNLKITFQYYSTRPFAVKSSHLLCRILTNLGVSYDTPLDRFAAIVDAKTYHYLMSFKVTTPVYTGIIHPGIFYGPNSQEVIIGSNEYINPKFVYEHWKNIASVTVVDHFRSDLDLMLPSGRDNTFESGTAVIKINLPALAIQYKAFLNEQVSRMQLTGDNPRTTAQFVHMYVLPNMLRSQLNMALFNRAYNLLTGAPQGKSLKVHPFHLNSYTKFVDDIYGQLLKYSEKSHRNFKTILKTFPTINGNFEDLMRLPDEAPTRQIVWTEPVARLKCIDWLTMINESHGLTLDKMHLNDFSKTFVKLCRDNVFEQISNYDTRVNIIRTIRDILTRCGYTHLLAQIKL